MRQCRGGRLRDCKAKASKSDIFSCLNVVVGQMVLTVEVALTKMKVV